jgi:phosphoribosylformimino-5-aminoimidazole carboxamide ribotide isomerase
MALKWQQEGAERLHLVDLNGAVKGRPVNRESIKRIVQAVDIPVQLGGGVRDMTTLEAYFDLGICFVILGTVAHKNAQFVREACETFPGRIILGIDARNERVAVEGWTEEVDLTPERIASYYSGFGIAAIVYTDIQRDGMGTGPNIIATSKLAGTTDIPVIASGGVGGLEHIRSLLPLADEGVMGIITGRALYDGNLVLSEAIRVAKA